MLENYAVHCNEKVLDLISLLLKHCLRKCWHVINKNHCMYLVKVQTQAYSKSEQTNYSVYQNEILSIESFTLYSAMNMENED